MSLYTKWEKTHHRITDSQTHKITVWARLEGTTVSHLIQCLCSRRVIPDHICTGLCPESFLISPVRETPKRLQVMCSTVTCTVKKWSSC